MEKTSARGWWGLARAYDGLNAYKNVMESCDRVIECTQAPRFQAIAHNMKGAALFSRAGERQPPLNADLAEAEREFRAALVTDPTFQMARYNLGMALLKQENDAAGTKELRAYLAAAPAGAAAKDAAQMIENPRRAREDFAPDFSLVTTEGEHLDLEGLQGKVVVLDFWASWCQPCRMTIPLLKSVRKRYGNDRVVMISVSVDSDAAAWRSALAREKMPWHQCLDSSGRIAQLFGVRPIPSTFVLDGEGVVRKRIVGYSSSFDLALADGIEKALKRSGPR